MVDSDEDCDIQINIFNPRDQYKKVQQKSKDVSSNKKSPIRVFSKPKVVASQKFILKKSISISKAASQIKTKNSVDLKKSLKNITNEVTKKENDSNTSLVKNKENTIQEKKIIKTNLTKSKTEIKSPQTKSLAPKKQLLNTNSSKAKIIFTKDLDKKVLKRKQNEGKDGDYKQKKFKASVIYTFDMETPSVKKVDVVAINENVFSKNKFSSLDLHEYMVSNLHGMGMEWMTEVQQKSIPSIIQGRDLLVKSQTGSGKTLTYGIPIVNALQGIEPKIKRTNGPYCIVVVPTRELVMQTYTVLNKLVKPFVWVVPGYLMGGEKRKSEKSRLKKGINIIVATPGRLIDHLDNTCCLDVCNVKYLVVDEADRMFEMGFEKDVSRVVMLVQQKCSSPFQTILLSATLSPGVEKLAGMSLTDPLKVSILNQPQKTPKTNNDNDVDAKKTDGGGVTIDLFSTPTNLKHHFVVVPTKLRLVTLATMLLWKCQLSANPCKAIVFLSTQDAVEFHHSLLEIALFSPDDDDDADDVADSDDGEGGDDGGGSGSKKLPTKLFKLYGDLDQKERMKVFAAFHKTKSGVLLCTDVAARGLDLPHIDWILQYNTPGSATDYIHRVGRTARIGCHGNALIFLAPSEVEYVKVLAEHRIALTEIKMNDILAKLLIEVQLGKIDLSHKNNVPRTVQDAASSLQTRLEATMNEDMHLRSLARKAYQSFVRAYATYPASLKHIFHIKNLHLGHLATSFALSESPSDTSKVVSKFRKKDGKDKGGPRRDGGRGGSRGGGRGGGSRGGMGGSRGKSSERKSGSGDSRNFISNFHHTSVSEFI